jgi:hypothetical protein
MGQNRDRLPFWGENGHRDAAPPGNLEEQQMTEEHNLCHNVTEVERALKQIARRIEKLDALWEEYKDRPGIGIGARYEWKKGTFETLGEFDPERARIFDTLHGNPHGEIKDTAERERKIFESEVQTYRAFLIAWHGDWKDRLNSLLVKEAEKQEPSPTEDSTGKARQRPKGKRGKRSRYSRAEKDDVVMEWERRLVAPSTFYDWRTDFYKRNPDWQPNKP